VPKVRHVALLFWLLPGIDMHSFNTATPFINDLGLARQNAKVLPHHLPSLPKDCERVEPM
jgi:hypothetical protein